MERVTRNSCMALMMSTILCLLVSAASAGPTTATSSLRLDRAARMMLQQGKTAPSSSSDSQAFIQLVKAAKNGDVKKRKMLVAWNYFEIGCGTKTRNRQPGELAANGLINTIYDKEFKKAGLVDYYVDVIAVAYQFYLEKRPTKAQCDEFYSSKRRL